MLENIMTQYHAFLYPFAELTAGILELVGILIIIVGSLNALRRLFRCLRAGKPVQVGVDLGKSLSLALEFKMGAEIIKTVIIHNLEELSILAVVILIRALLAFIIHWEIRTKKNDEKLEQSLAQSAEPEKNRRNNIAKAS